MKIFPVYLTKIVIKIYAVRMQGLLEYNIIINIWKFGGQRILHSFDS